MSEKEELKLKFEELKKVYEAQKKYIALLEKNQELLKSILESHNIKVE